MTHLKTPGARYSERVTQFDVRNNLVLVTRYFPEEWVLPYAMDWMKRYAIIAHSKGHTRAYLKGLVQGIARSVIHADRTPVTGDTFESFTKMAKIERRMREIQREWGCRRILFVDLGKNMLAYWLAAKRCGLKVVAIADPKLASARRTYRGAAIVDDETANAMDFDVAIVSNLSPVHVQRRREQWRMFTSRPVIDLFESEKSPVLI